MTPTFRPWRPLLAGAGSLCLLLSACSSTPAPSGSPTSSASAVVTPAPSPLPSSTPSPSTTGVPVSAESGFQPNSVTFVSLQIGWALGSVPCASGTCLALRRTLDAGRSWAAVAAPPTLYAPANSGKQGVGQIRFADPLDGWAFGSELWSTHDGGAHWTKSGLSDVAALEAADGHVHAIAFQQANGSFGIETSPTTRDAWAATGSLQIGAGPVPSSDLVLQGTTGWAIENDRTVVEGARLASGHWVPWHAPCATNGGTAVISTPTVSSMVAVCEEGTWAPSGYKGPPAVRAYFSNTGGSTFFLGGTVPGVGDAGAAVVASPSPGAAVTDAQTNSGWDLVETFNSGASWRIVATVPESLQFTYLGFTSSSQGVAIESGSQTSVLLMTFDGGRVWSPVKF